MRPTRRLVMIWIAFALPVLILAGVLWKGPGAASAQQRFVWKVQSAWPVTNLLHVSAVELARMIEEMWTRLKTLNETVAAMPHVIKYNDVPWNQNATTYLKNYTGPAGIPGWLSKVPIHTLDLREQMVFAGRKSGKHRHYQEAFFYIIEGEGYEIHDDKKYPWEAGDVMCVPTYCIHQHFNTGNQNARLFFNLPNVFDLMGLSSIEQIEIHERYQPPEGATVVRNAEGNVIGYKTASGEELRFGSVDLDYMKMMECR